MNALIEHPRVKPVLTKIFHVMFPSRARKRTVLQIYDARGHETEQRALPFLNYGYVPLSAAESGVELPDEPAPFRFSAQLYMHVSASVDLAGAYRVLKKGGHLLYTDIFHEAGTSAFSDRESMLRELGQSPFIKVASTDITRNVIASLDARAESVLAILGGYDLNGDQFRVWRDWARLPGTGGYQKLVARRDTYLSFIFRKE